MPNQATSINFIESSELYNTQLSSSSKNNKKMNKYGTNIVNQYIN